MDIDIDWRLAYIQVSYLIAALCFVIGLKRLGHPSTARRGNQLAAVGMALAVIATFFDREVEGTTNITLIVAGIVVGAIIATYFARTVQMTAMPQMVAIYNGMGGATAALVSVLEFTGPHFDDQRGIVLSVVASAVIGSISFSGSIIAFLKLQELMSGRPITYGGQQVVNAVVAIAVVALGAFVVYERSSDAATIALLIMFALALVLGSLVVLPIGGADMPVVIAILNSLTGLAAAITGFELDNQALVVAGILVGASGSLLTLLMARAMNRPVTNVLFGAFGAVQTGGAAGGAAREAQPVREISPDDAAVLLAYAERVIIVPGYGLAVAQAQHAVRELAEALEERGVDVKYAIHPVAGRMPGHMNVLLAEANVPYDDLKEMDEINDEFSRADVALVVGANDVVNPAARNDPSSPIYGMPILNVDQAKHVIVLKRSMRSGFAGIENELFHDPKTSMLFGDAKDSLTKLIEAVKAA